ncbi:MAG: acyltransferase family protein, partial [Planctomycetaceae bacterium]
MSESRPSKRLKSLDAYRGFIMLAMVSGGFAFANVLKKSPEILAEYDGTAWESAWQTLWGTLAYQFGHVEWTGCGFWDLIQPSFMFMVGVSMPFSYSKREAGGESGMKMFGHVLLRSAILVGLAVFLSSNSKSQTNFIFTNVLAQIGLGYPVLYLLWRSHFVIQLVAAAGILGGYWYFFYDYTIPPEERKQIETYLVEKAKLDPEKELDQFKDRQQFDGLASHWDKHTNAAAAFDREFLSRFPREEEEWHGRTYWINKGGYATLNFVPSIVTMLFGVMAGKWLRSDGTDGQKLKRLLTAGAVGFVAAMAVDTTIWPVAIPGCDWSLCPIVKRIWTPSWAVFSAGWTFWMLAAFYWVIDVRGWKAWSFPLVVVGMNSI